MRKIISVVIITLFFLSMTVLCFADEITELQRLENEVVANEQYNLLLQELSNQVANSVARNTNVDYYGGAYINDDGNLVVCVTDAYDASTGAIQAYTRSSDIIISYVDYTFNELATVQDSISSLYEMYNDAKNSEVVYSSERSVDEDRVAELLDSLRGTYIDEENNCLVVEIGDITQAKIDTFKQIFSDQDYLVFVEGYSCTVTSAWNPGRKVCKRTGSLSTGYPVYFSNTDGERVLGFVSAGHAFTAGDYVYENSGASVALGVCVASVFSGEVDAALIEITHPQYEVSFTTYYGSVSLPERNSGTPAQGTSICKEGATTGQTTGTVVSTRADCYYNEDGITISNLYKTTALNLQGDSGGVAYFTSGGNIIGSMSGSQHSGTELTESSFLYSYVCKFSSAQEELGFSVVG